MANNRDLHKLHPIEAFGYSHARQGEVRVERIEKRLAPRVPFPHRHDFYHFLFLEHSTGWHEIDFERHKTMGMQIFVVKPGQVHAWDLGKNTRGFVVEFTRESLEKSATTEEVLARMEAWPAMIALKKNTPFFSLLELMHHEFQEARGDFRLCLEHYLFVLLLSMARLPDERGVPRAMVEPALIKRFKQLLEKSYMQEHSVEFYARKLSITPKALTTQVTRILGKSAGLVIQERCLTEAKRLLAYSDLPVAEIGYRVGYDDPNYFARFFRQRVGMAPGKFRKLAGHSVPA